MSTRSSLAALLAGGLLVAGCAGTDPDTAAELTFDATIPGVFEVELHESGTALLTLQVS